MCKKPADATGPVTPAPTPVVPGYCPAGYYSTSAGRLVCFILASVARIF